MDGMVIIARGVGTQCKEIHQDIPKTLLEVGCKAVLNRIIAKIEASIKGEYLLYTEERYFYEELRRYLYDAQ